MILIVAEDIGLQMALVKMTGAGLVLMRGERPARVFSFKELMETDAIYIAKQIGHVLVSK
jgi:hypothetical protein